jgi:hypothetical protein
MIGLNDGWKVPVESTLWLEDAQQPMGYEVLRTLFQFARQEGGRLYALLDGARDDEIFRYLCLKEVPYRSLYQGTEREPLFTVSPILIECHKAVRIVRWLTSDGWGGRRAVFLVSHQEYEEVFHHLQQIVWIEDVRGVRLFLRLADPLMMHAFLECCTLEERLGVFGPVSSVLLEHGGSAALCFSRWELEEMIRVSTPERPPFVLEESPFVLGDHHVEFLSRFSIACFYRRACQALERLQCCCPALVERRHLYELVRAETARAQACRIWREGEILEYLVLVAPTLLGSAESEIPEKIERIMRSSELTSRQKLDLLADDLKSHRRQ